MTNLLAMSDEDFLKEQPPSVDPDEGNSSPSGQEDPNTGEELDPNEQDPAPNADPENDNGEGEANESEGENTNTPDAEGEETPKDGAEAEASQDGAASSDGEAGAKEGKADGEGKTGEKGTDKPADDANKAKKENKDPAPNAETTQPVALKPEQKVEAYDQIMAPFKANGKTIELKSPQEAIRLMQMGANYTRKLQELQPHRKVLQMLQSNELLDEDRLSYLIDLDKKNPDAIKKLVKDSGIDPLEIDTSVESAYQPGNHRVSDEEVAFRTVLEDVQSTQGGQETLRIIHENWDQSSKEALWSQPEIMSVIQQQRENGIYDRIATEIERKRTLGEIAPNVPFLQAYNQVGAALVQAGAFQDLAQKTEQSTANPTGDRGQPSGEKHVVATRTAAPKAVVVDDERARAASASRSSPRAARTLVNPLALPDDEFLAQMKNRL